MIARVRAATDTLVELAAYYAVLLGVCALAFSYVEGRDFWTSLYWAGITATSTGYGDISPTHPVSRGLALLLTHASIFILAPMIIVRLVDNLNENRHEFSDAEQEALKQDVAALKLQTQGVSDKLDLMLRLRFPTDPDDDGTDGLP